MFDLALQDISTGQQFRALLTNLPDEQCVAGIFEACRATIVYSRHHCLSYKGEYHVRAGFRSMLEDLITRDPVGWDDDDSDYVLSLFALGTANVSLDELRDGVSTATVREVLAERFRAYAKAADPPAGASELELSLIALASQVTALRETVERTHYLHSIIDGKAWFRTEGLIPREQVRDDILTASAERVLAEDFGIPPRTPAALRLRAATRACVAEHGDSAPLVRALMAAAVTDPRLRGDHVTLTCPQGDLLDSPELMTTSEAFFTETQLRDGLDLSDYEERQVHSSSEQVQRTIRARMLKLKRGAIRGLYGPGCIQGRFVEKHGGHMIFRNEDAHYRGHQSIGCSSGGRASFAPRYRSSDGRDEVITSMIGDLRVVRMSHDERDLFTAAELVDVIRYACWIKEVVEETWRMGAILRRGESPLDARESAGLGLERVGG